MRTDNRKFPRIFSQTKTFNVEDDCSIPQSTYAIPGYITQPLVIISMLGHEDFDYKNILFNCIYNSVFDNSIRKLQS